MTLGAAVRSGAGSRCLGAMPTRTSLAARLRPLLLQAATVVALTWCAVLVARPARAEFSEPPESPYRGQDPERREPLFRAEPEEGVDAGAARGSGSSFRFHVGPALLLEPASPGLFTALDVGQRAVGARLSAAWLRAESERGLSSYSAELWVDFRHRSQLHPVVGAGASFLRGGALGPDESAGAGSLRCALEYELSIEDADARVSLSALALVPAIGSERARPWTLAALTVGAGF